MMRIDLYECWYQGGENHHDACTHPSYCIFNPNRWKLEKKIAQLEKELEVIEHQLMLYHDIYTVKSKEELEYEKEIVKNDLLQLRGFRMKIIDNEVKEYGYEVLEFEGV